MGKTRGFSKMLICVFSFCFEANKTNKIIGNRRKFLLNSLPCSDMILKWWDISSKDKLELEEGPFLLIEGFKKPSGPPQSSMEPWICKMIFWKPINPVLEYEYGDLPANNICLPKGIETDNKNTKNSKNRWGTLEKSHPHRKRNVTFNHNVYTLED